MTRHQVHLKKKTLLSCALAEAGVINNYYFLQVSLLYAIMENDYSQYLHFCFSPSAGKTFLYRLTVTKNTTDSGSLLVQLYMCNASCVVLKINNQFIN